MNKEDVFDILYWTCLFVIIGYTLEIVTGYQFWLICIIDILVTGIIYFNTKDRMIVQEL